MRNIIIGIVSFAIFISAYVTLSYAGSTQSNVSGETQLLKVDILVQQHINQDLVLIVQLQIVQHLI